MNFLSKILAKFIGKSFVRKHVTTLLGLLAGLIAGLGLEIDKSILDKFISTNAEVLVALILYLIGLLTDAKPEKPELINK